MRSIINITIAILVTVFLFSSCKKTDSPAPVTSTVDTGNIYLEFFNVAGGSNLKLNNEWYKNENGDSFTVSKFNYYISNIVVNGSSGTANYTEQDSYHLIEHSATPSDMAFKMAKVPAGKYNSITFMIGVDSLHNVSGAQSGALDPTLGNFWSWSTGYIMLKFEGNSPKSPAVDGKVLIHCGGFSGANSVLKTVTINFPNEVEVTKSGTPHIHLQADILKLFKSPNVISFATTNTVHMPGTDATKVAANYAGMFTITYSGL